MAHASKANKNAPTAHDPATFKPYISDDAGIPEFTLKAILLGAVFGIIFGASTVYLGLRAGLTVSASIPIAVLAIAVFKRVGKSTILENNIVQTIGSAGESIAAGVVFTIPALYFLALGKDYFKYTQIFVLALVGGIIGVLFMIPLRRSLIVKEHGVLPYPEGTACADVLIAGEKGGSMAQRVFAGLGIAFVYKSMMSVFGLWKDVPQYITSKTSEYPNAMVSTEITPEYLGVGYIIGPRIAGTMFAGGVLSYLVLIPLITILGDKILEAVKPGVGDMLIRDMNPAQIRLGYVRYIGAGAVAMSGLITLIRTLPTIVASFRDSIRDLKNGAAGLSRRRVEHDIPITYVIGGSLALVLILSVLPQIPGSFPGSLFMGILMIVFGFFFVTVSSRIVGLIGSSSNPISGMTIATLMATCLLFIAIGWTGQAYEPVALCVGAIVCIAAANAGATSQDLKTGYIVGATPWKQQLGLIIGVLASVFAIGFTLMFLHNSPGFGPIGSEKLPGPQATLMATIIQGLLARQLPWGLVFVGMAISVVIELCGVRSLSFAVGAYLPISTTAPIFVGGLMKALAEKITHRQEESELSSGMLYATGLVAGGSLTGILLAVLGSYPTVGTTFLDRLNIDTKTHWIEPLGGWGDLMGIVIFALLCVQLIRVARKSL